MKCSGCGAFLIDGTVKCPFCKEFVISGQQINSDVTYKIDSQKQVEAIKQSTKNVGASKSKMAKMKKKRRQKMKAYCILSLIGILLIAVIVGIVALFVNLFSSDNQYTTAFYKDNEISLYYDGEVIKLTASAVDLKSIKDENIELSSVIADENLLVASKNGKTTCFIEKYDVKNHCGTLKVMRKNNFDEIISLGDRVNNSVLVSDDGEHILFLKNANAKGNQGELWYLGDDEPVKIADKVDKGRFVFSKDFKKVIYLKDYNYKTKNGKAYVADFDDFSEEQIDTGVYAVYGSSKDGDTIVYAKSYNSDNDTFDLHINNDDGAKRVVMGCKIPPKYSADSEYLFVCGDENEDRYSLYRMETDNADIIKVASNMSGIIKVSDDGEQVLYSKLFDNNVGDCYIWTEGEEEQKVIDGINYTKENQFAVSADFETVVYISNYNENKNGGVLYKCLYKGDSVTENEKIAEDVYSCYVLKNGDIVYTKNYNSKRKTTELYVFNGIDNEIESEINPEYLSVEKNSIICLCDYSNKTGGNLYIINENLEKRKITTDVYDFFRKKNGALTIVREKDSKTGQFDLYETDDNKEEVILIQKEADGILKY